MNKEIRHLKSCIKENLRELNNCVKYMDKASLGSVIRWSAWINKDANKILELQKQTEK